MATMTNAAERVFGTVELLELILLSISCSNVSQEIGCIRALLLSQATCRTWQALLRDSAPIRRRLYCTNTLDQSHTRSWAIRQRSPPARPNPWIPYLLLGQRGWGRVDPFESAHDRYRFAPTEARLWTMTIEFTAQQYKRLPVMGSWREMLACSPPFTAMRYTRCVWDDLGSGGAPYVIHVDYDLKLPKDKQKYCVYRPTGITLGDIVDALSHLFEQHPDTESVMIESLHTY